MSPDSLTKGQTRLGVFQKGLTDSILARIPPLKRMLVIFDSSGL